jgi:hypothetical protein
MTSPCCGSVFLRKTQRRPNVSPSEFYATSMFSWRTAPKWGDPAEYLEHESW